MNKKVLETLEYNKIINILEKYAVTYLGKEKVLSLEPSSNSIEIEAWQNETKEATSYLLKQHDIPLAPITNIDEVLNKVNIGGILSIKELLYVSDVLRVSRKLKNSFSNGSIDENEYPILANYFENLYSNIKVEEEIERCIKNEEELDDRASSDLYKIRRGILDLESKIKEKLNSLLKSKSKFLQEQVITFRDDRFVLPVKAEYKNEVPGLIHDQSSTGSTLFIEPTSIFNLNNDIKELKLKEQLEVQRILALLTQMVVPIVEIIKIGILNISYIDFAFAKGKYAIAINAFAPIFNDEECNFKNARHPLIAEDKVVPINIWFGKDFKSLIITGPNTGGKTVTLKTCGLLCLMAQSGLFVPVDDGSKFLLFENIYTDIGDEQSIEQSLSTFSAHMTNLVSIINNVTKNDLVLIDEIGSGTDPVEGAAIAMSILEYLYNSNCISIATTHYSELKTFAIQTPGIENASCEFDVETLRPTYKLLIGVPGKSNAFAISKKLGLKEDILNRANEFLSEEDIKFEDVLSSMEQDRIKAREEREQSKKILSDAEKVKAQIEKEKEKIDKQKTEIITKAREKARDLLLDAQDEANDIIKELTSIKNKNPKDAGKKAEEERAKLKKSLSSIQSELLEPSKEIVNNPIKKEEIILGMNVYIPSLDQEATICKLPDKNDNVMVQSGIVKLKIHLSQLEKTKEDLNKNNKNSIKASNNFNKSKDISTEIKLLGMTVDEAIPVLEKYLDDAYLSNVASVRVVHGKGTGALRKAVQEYLKKNPHVKSYRAGMFGEGDIGVTIVELA